MANWVSLKKLLSEAATDATKREEMSRLYIAYQPDGGKYTFPSKETGEEDNQVAKAERNLGGWHPFVTKEGEVFLISHEATEFNLRLLGKPGYDNEPRLLQEYGEIYGSKALEAKGEALTEEKYEELSSYLRHTCQRSYWLASNSIFLVKTHICFKAYFVYNGIKYVRNLYELDDDGTYQYHCDDINYRCDEVKYRCLCAIRPVVQLPSNILVDMGNKFYDGTTNEQALKIKREGDIINSSQKKNNAQKELVLKRLDAIEKLLDALKKDIEESE
jgi:hypothetical protein